MYTILSPNGVLYSPRHALTGSPAAASHIAKSGVDGRAPDRAFLVSHAGLFIDLGAVERASILPTAANEAVYEGEKHGHNYAAISNVKEVAFFRKGIRDEHCVLVRVAHVLDH